jgi:predicted nucleotidyltransferase
MKTDNLNNPYMPELKRYKERHAAGYDILAMGIFGSVARNEAVEESDIDVVVKLKQPDLFIMAGIKIELEAIYHKQVDVVNYSKNMNPYFDLRF